MTDHAGESQCGVFHTYESKVLRQFCQRGKICGHKDSGGCGALQSRKISRIAQEGDFTRLGLADGIEAKKRSRRLSTQNGASNEFAKMLKSGAHGKRKKSRC